MSLRLTISSIFLLNIVDDPQADCVTSDINDAGYSPGPRQFAEGNRSR